MGKLAVLYKTLDQYKAQHQTLYRYWHVEALLNQAADLVDRCLDQRRQLLDLDATRRDLHLRVSEMEAELALERQRLEVKWYEREELAIRAGRVENSGALVALQEAVSHASNASVALANEAGKAELQCTIAARNQLQASLLSEDVNLKSLDENSIFFRASIEKKIQAIEKWLAEARLGDGIDETSLHFDLDDQISALSSGITQDHNDAYDRASVANDGLKRLYDCPFAADFPEGENTNPPDLNRLDKLSLWLNKSLAWLTGRLQSEQVFTLRCALSRLAPNFDTGLAALTNGEDEAQFTFYLPINLTSMHQFVRLRGISAIAVTPIGEISGVFSVPSFGLYQRETGLHTEDQRLLYPCILGRISDMSSARAPEVCGVNSLINASVFGSEDNDLGRCNFIVKVEPRTSSPPFNDIVLEFSLAGLPRS